MEHTKLNVGYPVSNASENCFVYTEMFTIMFSH